jgi:ABC-type nitrate/sulfonate/bicarbonate transport system substrate-binding protein
MSAPIRLRLIQFHAGYNLVVHAAVEQNLFARHRLEIEVGYTPGSAYLTEALRAGEFDVGHTAADDIVADVESHGAESDLFLFMGLHSGLMSLVSAPEIGDLASLRGKEIAVDARTSGFVFILEKALRTGGLTENDYRLVEVGGWESRYRSLAQGKCSATLLTQPFLGQAVAAGCHVLARGDQIIPVYQGTCGAASRRWASQNADILAGYIRAYVAATRWCFDPGNRESCLNLLAKHNGLTGLAAVQTLDALTDPDYGLFPEAELDLPGVAAVLELRAEMGYLTRPLPPAEKYVDLSYYQRAMGSA